MWFRGNCDAKPECGDGADNPTCPLGVCCSQYGFCGTTTDFCGDGCQNGCETVNRPSCDASSDVMSLPRRIGYFGMFNLDKPCDRFLPEHVAAGPMTHINLAFVNIGSDFKLVDDPAQGDIINRVTHLKDQFPGLRVNIAVGGWNFNDPPTQHIFSDLVSTYDNQMTFINSVSSFLTKYGLDGIDIDWEYPVANDRGGRKADFTNFDTMLARLRESFDQSNPGYEISITLPSSYWYLRGFDLSNLQRSVDYFNAMTYDLHGMWDQHNRFTGPYLKGHTNITEIEQGLDLLWRNGVDSKKVVMGFGVRHDENAPRACLQY
nr:killer toxin subunits alpha/beta [Quercus suber]